MLSVFCSPSRYTQGKNATAALVLDGQPRAVLDRVLGFATDVDSFADDPQTILSLPRIFQVWGKRSS